MDLNDSTNDSFVSTESLEVIKDKILKKKYTISLKRGRSRVWEIFGQIENETGEIFPSLVACKKCCSILKFNKACTSNLVKHKCYRRMKDERESNVNPFLVDIDTETKKNVERLVLQWTIENCRPIDVIEDSGLQKLAECLIATGSKYGAQVDMEELLPQPAAISRNVAKLHADYVTKLKTDLKSIRSVGYGLTVGVWSDKYLSTTYLFLTIHYIKDGESVNRFLGLDSIEGDKCTGEDIKLATEEILNKFDCTLYDKPTVVIDLSENMADAFQGNQHIFCINHLLQSVMEAAIDETPDIKEICEQVTNLFNFLKNASKTFDNPLENGPTKRWLATFHMLSSISVNYKEIVKICKSHKGEELRILERINVDQLKELINILEPFEEVSKELVSEDSPTLHLAVAHMNRLRKMCIKNVDDTEIIKKFKLNLLSHFETYIWKNMTLQHKIALYLFPPAKKLVSFSQNDKDLVRTECQRIMQAFLDKTAPEDSFAYSAMQIDSKQVIHHYDQLNEVGEVEEENLAKTSTKTIKNPKIFEDFMESDETLDNTEERVKCEMRLYEDTSVTLHDNFDLLQWWQLHKAQFPLLYKTSCKVLATPATGAASERAVLKARPLIFENCSVVDGNPESVDEILFLHCNVEKNEMFYEMIMDENF